MQAIKENSSKTKIQIKSMSLDKKNKYYGRYLLNSSLSTCYMPKGS